MEKIKLYALLDNKSNTLSNVYLGADDVSAARFMVTNLREIRKDVPKDMLKDFDDRVSNTAIVKLGEVNPDLSEGFNILSNDYNVVSLLVGIFEENDNGKNDI